MTSLLRAFATTFPIALALLAGCEPAATGPDPAAIATQRERLLLADEPAGAVTAADLREAEEDVVEGRPVVLVGRVGGMPNPWGDDAKDFPWVDGEATFFLVDPAVAAEFAAEAADHAPDDPDHAANCPFCARKAEKKADSVATVTFLNDQGEPIAIGARELLDLKADDTVVVSGKARLLAGSLIVEADGLYVRR